MWFPLHRKLSLVFVFCFFAKMQKQLRVRQLSLLLINSNFLEIVDNCVNLLSYYFSEIPDGTKKCCSACFTKMTRKIAQLMGGGSGADLVKSEGPDPLWTDDEVEILKTCLRLTGRNWSQMSEKLNNKTSDQCKKFFYESRKKFQLDKLVLEYKRVRRSFIISDKNSRNYFKMVKFVSKSKISSSIILLYAKNSSFLQT